MGGSIRTLSLAVLAAAAAYADADYGAEVRIQQQALLTRDGDSLEQAIGRGAGITTSSLRLKTKGVARSWSYDVHYLVQGAFSDEFSGVGLLIPPIPDANALPLQTEFARGRYGSLDHRLDRASVTHSTPRTVVRLGRQALTWGRGQVFQPLDLFNPFSPVAQDRSYKPGADMAYAQYLFDSGADVQAIVVPRRRQEGGLTSEASSAAVKALWPKGAVELEAVAAIDYGDAVFAFGGAGPLGDALWRFDVVSTQPKGGEAAVSTVAGLEQSWSWGERPVSAFVEYYRNGFGVADRRAADALPVELTDRVARGQVFTTGRDYLAVGGTVDWTPLLQLYPTTILNLNDRSVLAILTARYSLSDDANLVLGAQLPFGRRGSEFGGRRTTSRADDFQRAPTTFYVRLERFF